MQRTDHFSKVFRQRATRTVFGIIACRLLLASVSVMAQASPGHLAMIRLDPAKINVSSTSPALAEPVRSAPLLITKKTVAAPETGPVKTETEASVPASLPIDKQIDSDQRNPLELVHENFKSNRSVVVAAGYGQLWNNQSMLKYISPARQEPSCAYVKASYNF